MKKDISLMVLILFYGFIFVLLVRVVKFLIDLFERN